MALRPASRMLSSVTGIVVLAAVLWFLLNFVYAPSCGRFSCGYEPAWWPRAEADAGAGCPASWREAIGNEQWLRDRLESIKDERLTSGISYDEDGVPTTFTSKRDDTSELAVKVGREVGAFPRNVRPTVVDHVEVKVAAAMREGGISRSLLLINQVMGPCSADVTRPFTCIRIVPKMLPAGAELYVFWEDDQGRIRSRRFVGEG